MQIPTFSKMQDNGTEGCIRFSSKVKNWDTIRFLEQRNQVRGYILTVRIFCYTNYWH